MEVVVVAGLTCNRGVPSRHKVFTVQVLTRKSVLLVLMEEVVVAGLTCNRGVPSRHKVFTVQVLTRKSVSLVLMEEVVVAGLTCNRGVPSRRKCVYSSGTYLERCFTGINGRSSSSRFNV